MMRAELFYQPRGGEALSLSFISKDQWEKGLCELTDTTRNALTVQQFRGRLGDVVVTTDSKGKPVAAYAGTGEDNLTLAMAH
ncbi:MAG: hypothetical protein OJI67_04270, partial [Prosthecobacter sp.]|nr:hypothetical protein [Prosthecobacter sp.]